MPFVATWMNLEIIILTEWSESDREKRDVTHIWNLILKKNWTYIQNRNDLQLLKTNLQLLKEKLWGRDKSEAWGEHTHTHTHTPIYKIDNQQRPTV